MAAVVNEGGRILLMKVALSRVILAGACWIAAPSDVFACVCVGSSEAPSAAQLTRELKNDLDDALAVFVGEPIARNSLTLRLRVQSVWKGELGTEVVMSTGAEATPDGLIRSSSCDFNFDFGQTYLIFGHGKTPETMKARACSFTGRIRTTELMDLLDGLAQRRPPSEVVAAKRLVAVVGSVRSPGLVEWSEGMTVAQAVTLAGGAVPPSRAEFADLRLASKIVRRRSTAPPEQHPAFPTAPLLPDDELFVAGDMLRRRP